MIQSVITRLLDGHDLSRDEARETMGEIMAGEATQAQIAGFLVALRAKGETADEIAGCAEAMREHVLRVAPTRTDLVDVVGTGGDGANTYNISTAAALVAAQVVAVEQPGEGLLDHSLPSRKLRARAGPSGVSTDSGWNWTPTIGNVRWRTAITSPSSANAVGCSSSGIRVAASEW